MKPWEKYQQSETAKPWERYANQVEPTDPVDLIETSRRPEFGLDPAQQAKVSVADFLSNRHGVSFDTVASNYETVAKQAGLEGNPESDYQAITHRKELLEGRKNTIVKRQENPGFIANLPAQLDYEKRAAVRYGKDVVRATPAAVSKAGYDSVAGTVDLISWFAEMGDARGDRGELINLAEVGSKELRELADFSKDAYGVSDSFDGTLSDEMLSGGATILTALGTRGRSIYGQLFTEAKRDAEASQGVEFGNMDSEAQESVVLTGLLYTAVGSWLERAGLGKIAPKWMTGKADVTKGALRKVVEAGLVEGATEAGQGQLLDSLSVLVQSDDRELIGWDVVKQRVKEFALGGVLGGGFRAGISAVENSNLGQRGEIEFEMDRNLAAFAQAGVEPSLRNLGRYLDPLEGATSVDWKLVDMAYDDEEVSQGFTDPELARVAVAAKHGDESAQQEYIERTTVQVDSELQVDAELSAEEVESMREVEATESEDFYRKMYPEAFESETPQDVKAEAMQDMLNFLSDRQLEGSTIEMQTDQAKSFEEDLNKLRDQGLTESEVDRHAFNRIQAAGLDPNDPANSPDRLSIFGENLGEFRRGVWRDVSKIYKGADPLTIVEETSEGFLKRIVEGGEVTWADVSAWRETLGDRGGDTEADLVEWFSDQTKAWMVGNSSMLEREGQMPSSFRRYLSQMFEYLRHVFARAAQLKGMDRRGELDADFRTALDRAASLDEQYLMDKLNEQESAQVASELESDTYTVMDAIGGLSGLPRPDMVPNNFRGEIETIWQNLGKDWRRYPKKTVSIDSIGEALREKGFQNANSEKEVLDLLERASTGEEIRGLNSSVDGPTYSLGRLDTPALKEWFGDSKVTDENGEPLVVYHGTNAAGKILESGFKGDLINLTDSKVIADSYQQQGRGSENDTLAVYARIENPAYFDAKGKKYTDHEANLSYKIGQAEFQARKLGHDGLIIKNIRDHFDSEVPVEPHNIYLVFDPTQIKSATGNRGTFDPDDPRITYSLGKSIDFSRRLGKRIGDEALQVEQPKIARAEKDQLLLDFSDSILGSDVQRWLDLEQSNESNNGSLQSLRIEWQKFKDGLEKDLTVDFIGEDVSTIEKLVVKAQSLRNPLFESFYYLAVDDNGVLVDYSAVTCRCPFSAKLTPENKNRRGYLENAASKWKAKGATSIYLMHNHPSGDPTPSRADVNATKELQPDFVRNGLKFGGHVVINHMKYTVIDEDGFIDHQDLEIFNKTPDEVLNVAPEKGEFGVFNTVLSNSDMVANWGARLNAKLGDESQGMVSVIIKGRKGDIRGGFNIDQNEFLDPESLNSLRDLVRSQGGEALLVYTKSETENEAIDSILSFKELMQAGVIFDVAAEWQYGVISGFDMGFYKGSLDSFMGEPIKGIRISEPSATYSLGRMDAEESAQSTARERTPEERILAQKLREFRQTDTPTKAQKDELKKLQVKAVESRKRQRLQQSGEKKLAAAEEKRLQQIKMLHEQGEDVTTKLEQLDAIRKTLPTTVRHRLGGDVQVSKRKTRMGRQNEINRRIVRAQELSQGHEAMKRKAWLRRTLKRFGTQRGEKLQGLSKELTRDVRDRLRVALYAANSQTPEAVIERMEKPASMSQKDFEETARDFVALLAPETREYGRIEAAYFAVQDLMRSGKYEMDQFRKERREDLDALARIASNRVLLGESAMNDSEIDQREQEMGVGRRVGRLAGNYLSAWTDGFENIIRRMDGGREGDLWKELYADHTDGIDAATNRTNNYILDAEEMLLEGLSEAFPDLRTSKDEPNVNAITKKLLNWERHPKRGEKTGIEMSMREGERVKDQPLSVMQAITVKLLIRQPGSHETFFVQHGVEDVAAFESAVDAYIGEEGLRFVDKVITPFFDGAFHQLNDVHKRVEGYELDPVENYFPFIREIAGMEQKDPNAGNPFAPFDTGQSSGSIEKGSLRTRSEGATMPFKFRSALPVLQNAVRTNANYIGKAGLEKKFRRLVTDPEFKRALKQRFGKKGETMFADAANTFVAGRVNQEKWGEFLDAARSRMITGVLAAKPKIMLTQLTSIPAGMVDMPVSDWAKGVSEILSDPARKYRELANTPAMRHRLSQSQAQETITSLNRLDALGLGAGFGAKWEAAIKYSMLLIKAGDIAGASLAAGPVYFKTKADAIKAGKSEPEARQEAEDAFSRAVNRSQQSPHLHARSQAYQQSAVLRGLFAFRSSPMQYQSEVNTAIREYVISRSSSDMSQAEKKKVLRQSAKAFFVYHLLLPQLFYAVNNALTGFWLDDEDRQIDYWKGVGLTALLGNFAAVPIVGDMLYASAAKLIDASHFRTTVAPVGLEEIARLPGKFDKLFTGDLEERVKVASEIANFTGLPVETVVDAGEDFFQLIETGDVDEALQMMGWSEFIFE